MRRTVDMRWIRRTLERVEWLANRAGAEKMAEVLIKHGAGLDDTDEIGSLGQYLLDVSECMKGVLPTRQEQPCVVCGKDKWIKDIDRTDARYCSAACRQRAYRKRVTARTARRTAKPSQSAVRDTSCGPSAPRPVTHDQESI